jgi:hypothetical protein
MARDINAEETMYMFVSSPECGTNSKYKEIELF